MVEGASEVAKPDYLSLVNKSGSGFNVSELVDAIVGSEIEPKRSLQKAKQDRTENAISGIGFLKSQANTTQSNFETLKSDVFFEISSSNSSGVIVKASDETKLEKSSRTISDDTANYQSQKTYIVTSEISDADDINSITANSSWPGTSPIAVGETFTVNDGASGSISAANIKEIDVYAFTDSDLANSESLNFTDKSVSEIAALLNAIDGFSATTVDTDGQGTNYSIVVMSDETGANNGFRITGESRFETATLPEANSFSNSFSQLSSDASFNLDGVDVVRESNSINDLIDGATIELKSDFTTSAVIDVARSDTAIRATVDDVIFSLNEFKAEIDRLTFIDLEGDENGPLALDPAVNSIKSKFKKLAVEPITGYGDNSIYLSQLGIKTDSNGDYYLDEVLFEKTLASTPEYFQALKDENLATSTTSASVVKSSFTTIDVGTYAVTKVGDQWKLGDTDITRFDYYGGSRFTSATYPGLVITTAAVEPSSFNIFVGESFATRVTDLMAEMVELGSPLRNAEETYTSRSSDIEDRLKDLEEREKVINQKYTEQFGQMEQSMTQFNSTKTLLENFIEAWKKQKV